MKFSVRLIALIILVTTYSSCTLYVPYQRIRLEGGDPDATYFVNSAPVDIGDAKIVRKKMPFVVAGSKYGCKTKSDVRVPKRIDGMLIASALFYPLFPFEFLLPGGPKKHKKATETFELDTIAAGNLKDVYIASHSSLNELKLNNVKSVGYKKYRHYRNSKHKPFADEPGRFHDMYSSNTSFEMESKVDELLEIMKCKNDIGSLISRYDKFISLSVRVKEGESTYIRHGSMKKFDLKLEWYFNDRFNHAIDSMEVIASSQWMYAGYDAMSGSSYSLSGDYTAMYTLMEDALIRLIHNPEFEERIRNVKNKLDTEYANQPDITIHGPIKQIRSLKEAIEAQVTVMVDDYHGSGSVISPDGHILTSYKIIQDADSIDVMLMNGSTFRAEVLRKDALSNVALLKIDTTGLQAFQAMEQKPLKLGSDLFAIGTPADKILSQTITRGIVSGSRFENDIHFIQTDARLSAGDNGCPLVTSDGALAGIVNEKIIDHGVEGLSFAVPIATAFQRLKIRFQ
jgi:S1-C subfamily serine protease